MENLSTAPKACGDYGMASAIHIGREIREKHLVSESLTRTAPLPQTAHDTEKSTVRQQKQGEKINLPEVKSIPNLAFSRVHFHTMVTVSSLREEACAHRSTRRKFGKGGFLV
jgi:hypothetical protein